jgi:uncharacterized protein YwgA
MLKLKKTFTMKRIILTIEQQAALLKVTLESFKESGLAQAIRDEHTWWANNILKGKKPYRVDRLENTTYEVYMNPE